MLRHARYKSVYWFCTHCWQEMPNFSATVLAESSATKALGVVGTSSLVAPKKLLEIV